MHVGDPTIPSAEVVDAMPHFDKAPTFWQIHHSGTPSQYFSIYACICGRVLLFLKCHQNKIYDQAFVVVEKISFDCYIMGFGWNGQLA